MTPEERDISRKLRVLTYAKKIKNVSKTCRYFGISRTTSYEWKRAYEEKREPGLINRSPGPSYGNAPHRYPDEVYEKILYLWKTYHMGPQRIVWYLERYHDIRISSGAAHKTLLRHGLNKLPQNCRRCRRRPPPPPPPPSICHKLRRLPRAFKYTTPDGPLKRLLLVVV